MNRSRVKGYGFSWANTVNNLTYTSPFWMLALILLNLVPRIKALSTNIDIGKTSFASSFIGTMATTKVFKSVNATKVVQEYNEQNGTDYSIEDYNARVLGQAGGLTLMKYAIKDKFANLKQSFNEKKEAAGGGFKGGLTAIGGMFVDLANSIGDFTGLKPLSALMREGDFKGFLTYGLKDFDTTDPIGSVIKWIPPQLTKMSMLPTAIPYMVGKKMRLKRGF